jgi:transposase-like protein
MVPTEDKVGSDGRVYRSATTKLTIINHAEAHGSKEAAEHHQINRNQVEKWLSQRKEIERAARIELKQAGKASERPPALANGHTNGHAAPGSRATFKVEITEMESLVKELVREAVARELPEALKAALPGAVAIEMAKRFAN